MSAETIAVTIYEYTSPGVTTASSFTALTDTPASYTGQAGKVAAVNSGETGLEFIAVAGTGTVTSVSVTTANGISGSVTNATTAPSITLTLGAITPASVAAVGTVTGSNLSGTNTGDQTTITGNAGTVTSIGNLTGPVTSTNRATAIANNALSIAMTNGLQTALDAKQATLVSGTNIRTVNGNTLLGSTDLVISGGASTFLALTDTPASYSGQAGKLVKVNPTGDALIFGDPSGASVSWGDITGTIASQTDLTPANIGAAATSHTHTASQVTDFEAAVTANASVTANTAKVTNQNHTGDATGSTTLTLATVNSNVGSFGSATQSVAFTVNAKGLVTAASATTITPAVGNITGLGTGVATALGVTFNATGGVAAWTANGSAFATLTNSADTLPYFAGGGTMQTATITAAARTVIDDATVGDMVNTLGGATSSGSGGIVRTTTPTLTDPTVNNYTEGVVAIGNSGTTQTIALTNGTFQTVTLTGNCTFTMPTATAGKSFFLKVLTGAGGFTGTFTGVKWPAATTPTITVAASKYDLISFVADGTAWSGSILQNYSV